MRRVWLLDLDNTLHDANPHIFPRIAQAMTQYLMLSLDLEEKEADDLRHHYWQRYGATLTGMMRHHQTDPHDFLKKTHPFPDLYRIVRPHRGLHKTLRRLLGQKWVFTNAPLAYAEKLLRIMRVRHLLDGVCALEQFRFRPKPDPHPYRFILRRLRVKPHQVTLVDDDLGNLATARRLGFCTVRFGRSIRRPHWVRQSVRELPALLRLGYRK